MPNLLVVVLSWALTMAVLVPYPQSKNKVPLCARNDGIGMVSRTCSYWYFLTIICHTIADILTVVNCGLYTGLLRSSSIVQKRLAMCLVPGFDQGYSEIFFFLVTGMRASEVAPLIVFNFALLV